LLDPSSARLAWGAGIQIVSRTRHFAHDRS
jgi:hypothetical protein